MIYFVGNKELKIENFLIENANNTWYTVISDTHGAWSFPAGISCKHSWSCLTLILTLDTVAGTWADHTRYLLMSHVWSQISLHFMSHAIMTVSSQREKRKNYCDWQEQEICWNSKEILEASGNSGQNWFEARWCKCCSRKSFTWGFKKWFNLCWWQPFTDR